MAARLNADHPQPLLYGLIGRHGTEPMRLVDVSLNYDLPVAIGGEAASADVRHATFYLGEVAVALDAFEEDKQQLAKLGERALLERGTGASGRDRIFEEEYLKRRIRLHARAFVWSLFQVGDALRQLGQVCPLPQAAAALKSFEDAFSGLVDMRNSLAHAAERARRGPEIRNDNAKLYQWLGLYGFEWESEFFVTPRARNVEPHSVAITQASLDTTTTMLKALVASLTEEILSRRSVENAPPCSGLSKLA